MTKNEVENPVIFPSCKVGYDMMTKNCVMNM